MKNLNAEQLKEAMQGCIDRPNCIDCPNLTLCAGHGFEYLLVNALALINSMGERIEKLTEENDELYRLVDDKIQENQRLALLSKATAEVSKTVRNEVIDEFADMVKEKMQEVATGKRTSLIGTGWIYEIARELKGE